MSKTSLSFGLLLRPILLEALGDRVTNVYPIVSADAQLPYVAYRRKSLDYDPVKQDGQGADSIYIEVACYATTYEESVELAETVRAALNNKSISDDELVCRRITLSDAEEVNESDAWTQYLLFKAII